MPGRRSRRKGARGEREVFALLNSLLGYEAFRRNLMQSREGGADDNTHPLVAMEVKRAERVQLTAWVNQAKEQAERVGKIPVLAFRQNNSPWRVLVELTPEQFAGLLDRKDDWGLAPLEYAKYVKEAKDDSR